jgi:hypothetical protein
MVYPVTLHGTNSLAPDGSALHGSHDLERRRLVMWKRRERVRNRTPPGASDQGFTPITA